MSLRYLFVDMNSYFASVEQQDRPELRGRPTAVIPLLADTTSCIAASYEAKRFGVKTGTMVRDARRMCPGIRFVEARTHRYVEVHHEIIKAVESCLHVDKVMSVDEMSCRLMGEEQEPIFARIIAGKIKTAIRKQVGEYLKCSIGLSSNVLLAKVAADMQKPDGLTVIESQDLPGRLHELALRDFPGIGKNMEERLMKLGITTVQKLCSLSLSEMIEAWNSKILGESWWHRLRGVDLPDQGVMHRSISHSHVLAPELRTDEQAKIILDLLLHKAAARMRESGVWARSMDLAVVHMGSQSWRMHRRMDPCHDTLTLLRFLAQMWKQKPEGSPLKVAVALSDFTKTFNVADSLFPGERQLGALSVAMDKLNQKFGQNKIYFAGIHGLQSRAPDRIAFGHIPAIQQSSNRRQGTAALPVNSNSQKD